MLSGVRSCPVLFGVKLDVSNICGLEFLIRLAFFPVEYRDVLYRVSVSQENIDLLITHASFRQPAEVALPKLI